MTEEVTPPRETTTVATLRLLRLSAPRPIGTDPTFHELGLRRLEEECEAWQLQRTGSVLWELNMSGGRLDAWREIPVLMGSTAESALLAGTAEVEIECLRRAITAGDLPKQYGLAQRFFVEAQGNQILGCGHRLANIALRTLMLTRGYPWGVDSIDCARPIAPFSDRRADWIAMSELRDYRKVAAASPHRSLDRLVAVVMNIASTHQWQSLESRRGTDFHRARDESPFVAGSGRASAWRTEPGTLILEPRDEMPSPDEVDRWLSSLGSESHDALVQLDRWLRLFREALYAAMPDISGGTFTVGTEL